MFSQRKGERKMAVKLALMILAAVFLSVGPGLAPESRAQNLPGEVEKMREFFREKVGGMSVTDDEYLEWFSRDAAGRFLSLGEEAKRSQYFLYVDRNPNRQVAWAGFFNAPERNAVIVGLDKVSSGNEKRKGFFITPTGAFKNSPENLSYRALGTKNDKGWRGLGTKGSRVWDLGWQKTIKKGEERLIRLLVHATDPDFGEVRLGAVDYKGCVRVSGKFNRFLDHYGLLDRGYEARKDDKRVSWVLNSKREPVFFAGQYVLVGDSGL